MKSKKSLLPLAMSIFILFCLSSLASARTSFHFGIGHGYSHNGRYGRHHRRVGSPWYRNSFGYAPRHHYWQGYWGSPFVGFWLDDWYLDVITETPVIVERPKVIIKKEVIVKPKYDNQTLKLFKRLRTKKGELLRKLKLTDKETRKKSINELAGFSHDNKVRKALEDILLSDPDPELRIEVAKSFAKVKNDRVIPALEKARVEDSEKEVRKEADKAIKAITEH